MTVSCVKMLGRCAAVVFRLPVHSRLSSALTSQCHLTPWFHVAPALPLRLYATDEHPADLVRKPSQAAKNTKSPKPSGPDASSSTTTSPRLRKKGSGGRKRPGRQKKELTPTQQKAEDKRKAKAKLLQKQTLALNPPTNRRKTAYGVFFTDYSKQFDERGQNISLSEWGKVFGQRTKDIASKWKSISPAEREHFNHLANTVNEATFKEYRRWVESHSPEQIRIANAARKWLRQLHPVDKKHVSKWSNIHDERNKRPATAFIRFSVKRIQSGDFHGIRLVDRSKLIGQEWRELDATEKETYKGTAVEDSTRVAPVSAAAA